MSLSNLPGLKLLLLCTLMFPKTSSVDNSGFSSGFFSRLRNAPLPNYDGETRKLSYSLIIKPDSLMPSTDYGRTSDIDKEVLHSFLTGSKKPNIPKQPSRSQLEDDWFGTGKTSIFPNRKRPIMQLPQTNSISEQSRSQKKNSSIVSSADLESLDMKDYFFGAGSSSNRKDPPPNDSDKDSIVRQASNQQSRLPPPRDDEPSRSRFPLARDHKPSSSFPPRYNKPRTYSEWNHQNTDTSGEPACECGLVNSQKTRIVSGKTAIANSYILMALEIFLDGICGGAIITIFHILSAAHCFFTHLDPTYGPLRDTLIKWQLEKVNISEMVNNAKLKNPQKRVLTPNEIIIAVGTHNMNERDRKNEYDVAEVILHEDYDDYSAANDIAILVITKQIQFNEIVSPACLPNKKIQLEGNPLKIIGWGQTGRTADRTFLQEADFKIIPFDECQKEIKEDVTEGKQICLDYSVQAVGIGDSGGPVLYYDYGKGNYIQAGVVSTIIHRKYISNISQSQTMLDDIGIQTDVFGYISWIKKTISRTKSGVMACTVDGLFI